MAATLLVVAVLAGLAALLFLPREEAIAPSVLEPQRERTPAFAFRVPHTGALPTAQLKTRKPVRTDPMLKLRGASKVASGRVIALVTRLYRGAFLNPANWRAGSYVTVWHDFAPSARHEARRHARVLTAGSIAGEAYAAITPRPSTITTTVLLDRNGRPAIVLASARFRAVGWTIAGTSDTRFESIGRFFFERAGGVWRIVSFDVRRRDRKVDKPSGASATVSPSETGS